MDIFQNRNFTLMFAGRILTNIGDSLYAVAAMWLVYDLGGSTLYTGLAGFLSLIPRLIQLLSGPIIDRLPIRSILVYTQFLQGILLLIVPLAAYGGFLSVGLVLTLTPILSACNMWVYPAQLSALPRLVAKKHLTQGNSLFSIAYQGMEVACNALSGALIALLGAISLYLWNSVGFFIGALLFAQLRIPATPSEEATATEERKRHAEPKPASHPVRKYISDMREGIRLLVATPLSRLLFGVIAINAAGGATFSLLPAFSSQIGGPGIYGILLTSQALCSLIGAICSPYVKLERLRLGFLYSIAYLMRNLMVAERIQPLDMAYRSPLWPGLASRRSRQCPYQHCHSKRRAAAPIGRCVRGGFRVKRNRFSDRKPDRRQPRHAAAQRRSHRFLRIGGGGRRALLVARCRLAELAGHRCDERGVLRGTQSIPPAGTPAVRSSRIAGGGIGSGRETRPQPSPHPTSGSRNAI